MDSFVVVSLSPIEVSPTLAIATLRAGCSAWLDAEFLARANASIEAARANVARLCAERAGDAWPGLRLTTDQVDDFAPLLRELASGAHWVVLVDGARPLGEAIARLPPASQRRLLWEISDIDRLATLDEASGTRVSLDGILGRGDECGGWGGGDSAFILTQKLAAAGLALPFYVRGAIGPSVAAACRLAGAAGVVLSDELLSMPESPLPGSVQQVLRAVDGQEARDIGDGLGVGCRILLRRDLPAAVRLQEIADALRASRVELPDAAIEFRRRADGIIGWGSAALNAWPIGQGIAFAETFRKRYRTTGRLLKAIDRASASLLEGIAAHPPLAPDSAFARSQRTRYPIVQGPMTRVSDSPAFAAAVADAGALPLLALAMMGEEEARTLLRQTREALGDRPWGVGILGFVPREKRDEQLRAIAEVEPPFALIAGGRPDQAVELERHGVATYLHTPVPGLLCRFLDQGCRRFAFEGRECGGHIGPLSSFALWQVMVETLLDHASDQALRETHLLFAGGIHDPLSAAMVSAIAAPLVERGVEVGVIVGSAYLFTNEAVESGAISECFQKQALDCRRTVTIQTGLGHVIRVAPSPFVQEFEAARGELLGSAASVDAMRATLDEMGLGRARIASKGLVREGGRLVPIDAQRQERDGMFMMGSLATLRHSVVPMATLHESMCQGSVDLLATASDQAGRHATSPNRAARAKPARIAIVGMSCLLPGARQIDQYWRNLLTLPELVTEIPRHRWDWRVQYSEDAKAADTMHTKWGGFFDEVPFDPLRYGIPPKSMKSLSTSQLLALEVVRWALTDAGYERGDFDRENTAVIIGTGANGDLEQHYMLRTLLPLVVENLTDDDLKRLPVWTEESFAGVLANVTAGRIANRFDLGGANYTVDAACASGLTVIDLALSELRNGRSNTVLAAGLDFEQTPYFYQGFSRVQAVSPRGRARSFDRDADGIVISEGMAVVVLKRLDDAIRDGDRIYSVIQSATGSSDGKGLGMTAPRSIGQRRALRRAYEEAGVSPAQIGLYEAHGTGTPVGDKAEVETIHSTLVAARAAAKSCAVGSVKSLLGHTKAAAGVVGLVKAALALHHRTLPPHANVERPLPELADPESPIYLLREARPWLASDGEPRRAGVSAFGFGGTNYHAVLEEYCDPLRRAAPGGDRWPWELFLFRAGTREELTAEIRRVLAAVGSGRDLRHRDIAYTLALRADARRSLPIFMAVVAGDGPELRTTLKTIEERLEAGAEDPVGPLGRIQWQQPSPSPVALVFPGQGSQQPNMAREAVLYFRELRQVLEEADRSTAGCFDHALSQIVYPASAFTEAEEGQQRAHVDATHVAQPAIGAVSLGLLDLTRRLGLEPAMVAGHSFGELTALCAANAMSRPVFLRLAEARGRAMARTERGTMAAVNLGGPALEAVLAELGTGVGPYSSVVVANRNAPDQSVLSGAEEAVQRVLEHIGSHGLARGRRLPVSAAFHSTLMQPADGPFREEIARVEMAAPSIPVYSTERAEPYPASGEETRARLGDQLMSPVDFVGQIEAMYRDGARVFVETGPGRVLTGLIDRILGDRPHTAAALDGGGLKGLLLSVAQLEAAGAGLKFEALFDDRECRWIDFAEAAQAPEKPATLWYVDGGRVRTPDQPYVGTGTLPLLSREQVLEAREKRMKVPVTTVEAIPQSGQRPVPEDRRSARPVPAATVQAHGASAAALQAYEAYQETMRHFLATQEAVMARVLGGAAAHVSYEPSDLPLSQAGPLAAIGAQPDRAPAAIVVAQTPSVSEPAADRIEPGSGGGPLGQPTPTPSGSLGDGPMDQERFVAALTAIVSARTGYPEDTLDQNLDLEADLGVDSIKRLEILDAISKELPVTLQETVQGNIETLVREKTLAGWARALAGLAKGADAPAAHVAEPLAAEATRHDAEPDGQGNGDAAFADCRRYVVSGRPCVLETGDAWEPRGPLLVTEDEFGIASRVVAALEARGLRAELVGRDVLRHPGGAERWLEGSAINGGIGGLVHLAPLANGGVRSVEEWRLRTEVEVKSLFGLLRTAARQGHLEARDGRAFRVLGATLLGGAWGRSPHRPDCDGGAASSGGVYGVIKTMASEYSDVVAQVVDFDRTLDPQTIGANIVDELLSSGQEFEVGYPGGRRTIYRAQPAPLRPDDSASDLLPRDGWVVLVTGGARGITAELTQRLAAPGVRLVIVGRSPLPGEPDPRLAGLDGPGLRTHLLQARRAAGQAVRPAEIETAVRALVRDREIRDRLAQLEAAGAIVHYIVADVRTELEQVVQNVYDRFDRLDAVLHGAGVIEDRLLFEKSRDSFERVFDTKADSSFVLARALRRESLRWVVLMSSISGRIGNRGQVDYAAGNEVMNRLAWQMSRDLSPARVLAINWGPWTGAGMANDGVIRELASRGVPAITLETGWQFLRRELLSGSAETVEVIAGDHPDWT